MVCFASFLDTLLCKLKTSLSSSDSNVEIMVASTRLAVTGWAIAGAFAAPTVKSLQLTVQNIDVEERAAPEFELGADHLARRQDYT